MVWDRSDRCTRRSHMRTKKRYKISMTDAFVRSQFEYSSFALSNLIFYRCIANTGIKFASRSRTKSAGQQRAEYFALCKKKKGMNLYSMTNFTCMQFFHKRNERKRQTRRAKESSWMFSVGSSS